jgi:RNA polymerase sigma-54 factor
VADRLGVHETTVSRAIANKYMATPAGTFKFRDFFTGGYQNTEGEDVSSSAVKEYIREAVKNENPAHPLSDQKIVEGLKKKGLDVARRTVAKYREELGIPSSQGRKQYT